MPRPKKQSEESKQSIVSPIIRSNGENHILEDLEGSADMPILKSVGVARVGHSRDYISYTITSQGRQVLHIEVSEPNMRAIAEESGKIEFVQHFCSGDME